MHPPFAPVHLAPLVRAADAVLARACKLAVHDPDGLVEAARGGENAIFVCRHGQLWSCLWAVRGTGARILVSRSDDGDLLARLLAGWGFSVSRGSSSEAGLDGARSALRALREGRPVGLAVDGPRGPRGVVQEGSLRLARRAGVSLIPLRVTGSGRWTLHRSWDHFEVPRPWGEIVVEVGPRIEVGPGEAGLRAAEEVVFAALAPSGEAPGPPVCAKPALGEQGSGS